MAESRVLPHNLDAEKSALGAAISSEEALSAVIEKLHPDDFYDKNNKEIFKAILKLTKDNSPVDILTVSDMLKRNRSLKMIGGKEYLEDIVKTCPDTSNAEEYAKIVSEKASLRKLIISANEIINESFKEKEEVAEIIGKAEKNIFEISQEKQRGKYSHIEEALLNNVEAIDKAQKSKGGITGVATGFKDLDQKTSGLQKSDLIILAARPAMGKTAFALSIARNAAVKFGASVMIFSMEMSKEQLSQRLLSMEARIELQKLKTGEIDKMDWSDINDAIDVLSRANIFIDDTPGISITEMKSKCRKLKAESGLDLVIIDYLQLMSMEGRTESRTQEITGLSRNLKLLARELNCPVIVLSQLSRAPEQRNDHRPMLSDLRESGSIEQDADIVLFLYRDEYYNGEQSEAQGECEVIVAKHRSGPTGVMKVAWIERFTQFRDKATSGFINF